MPISKIKSSAIDPNAITGAGIADGTVDTADLAAGAVTSAKLDTNIAVSGTLAAGSTVTAVGGMTSSAASGNNLILATNGGTTNADTAVFQGNAGSYYNQMFLYGSGESYFQTNGTSLTFGTVSNTPVYVKTNNINRMVVDANGYVTKPNQVSFWTWLNANQTGYDGFTASSWGTQYVEFNYEEYDIGGGYQSNGADIGKFIAPVAGTYWFGTAVYGQNFSSGGWGQAWFNVNGARKTGTDIVMSNATGGFIYYTNIIKLAVNDAVTVHPYSSAGNTNVTIQANANHTWFKGYLLG